MNSTIRHNSVIEAFIRKVQESAVSALLLDYDGTLAPFSLDRDFAVPYPGVRPLLQQIVNSGHTRLVIITGRNAAEIEPLLGIQPLPEIWGAHGLQRLRPSAPAEMPKLDPGAAHALANAERWLAYQGVYHLSEPKPGSLAVHWRGLDESAAEALRSKVRSGWSALARNYPLSLLEFDGGLELRLAAYDIGSAVRTILDEIRPETPVAYLGDDRTDEPAFRMLRQRGLTVLVRAHRRHTSAQLWLRPPDELLEFLRLWCDAVQTSPARHSALTTYAKSAGNTRKRNAAA